jgi:hypothetical protein
MDQAWFLFLNGLPASVPALGTIAVIFSKYGPVCYAALLAWLWWRRRLLLAVVAATLSLAVNVGLNIAVPRPRPFLVIPAHALGGHRRTTHPSRATTQPSRRQSRSRCCSAEWWDGARRECWALSPLGHRVSLLGCTIRRTSWGVFSSARSAALCAFGRSARSARRWTSSSVSRGACASPEYPLPPVRPPSNNSRAGHYL